MEADQQPEKTKVHYLTGEEYHRIKGLIQPTIVAPRDLPIEFWQRANAFQIIYSIAGLVLGFVCIIGGIILFLRGVTGATSWTAEILGAESHISDAAPGAVLFVIGLFVVFVTRYKADEVLKGAAVEKASKEHETISKRDRDLETYVEDRVEYKINKYQQCADRHRRIYWALASTTAVGAALVPVLVNLQGVKWATTIVSLLVAITVALERLFRPREQWRNYDLISALLREEEMKFSTRTGPYCRRQLEARVNNPQPGSADEDTFARFVERVEDAIHREREETIVMRTAQDASAREQK